MYGSLCQFLVPFLYICTSKVDDVKVKRINKLYVEYLLHVALKLKTNLEKQVGFVKKNLILIRLFL